MPRLSVCLCIVLMVIGGCAADGDTTGATPRTGGPHDYDASVPTGDPDSSVIIVQPGTDAPPDGWDSIAELTITPDKPVFDVTVVDGKVTAIVLEGGSTASVQFTATAPDGRVVPATWAIDRGELGALDPNGGAFAPDGTHSGQALITALFSVAKATTTVTVRVHASSNGPPDGYDPTAGGVGGEGLGGKVDQASVDKLKAANNPPVSASQFGLIYPYDGTTWPRGVAAPLLQWETALVPTAVRIHMKQDGFEFEGYYSGAKLVRQPIEPAAWAMALNGNGGDRLHVDITILAGTTVFGPIGQDWIIAAGPLRGTVYYNAYNTALAKPLGSRTVGAAILAIRPGASDPVVALQGAEDKCIACHTVADDGQSLFAQIAGNDYSNDYDDGASFDLKNGGVPIANYTGSAPDGTTNNRKFAWSAPSRDGTFALVNNGHVDESYGGPIGAYRRDNARKMTVTGLDGITQIVTPAFSRDGKKVAFSYWTGTAGPGGSDGHSIDIMDVECIPPEGGVVLGAPSCETLAFSNLRRLFTTPDLLVGFPAWLPASNGIVFHAELKPATFWMDSAFSTWRGAQAQIWFVDVPADAATAAQPLRMNALNGTNASGASILPTITTSTAHDDDYRMNYEPTVNPIVSGGYNWVVFTSRRAYGNVLTNDPYESEDYGPSLFTKKLWVAAVDLEPTPGVDPSHPPFYLPGQELKGANMRGFWAVEPCRADGQSCETGDECCGGFCRPSGDGGGLTCGSQTPNDCAHEYEHCVKDDDCCGVSLGYQCINGYCAQPQPVIR